MKKTVFYGWIFLATMLTGPLWSALQVGVAHQEITPPIGTPSAGYADRKGKGMEGVHDPLMVQCLFIDNGEKKLAFCSVDHLGLMYEMVRKIGDIVHAQPGLADCELFIGASHTHSGAGAFLNLPIVGPLLAGKYDSAIVQDLIQKTAEVVIAASQNTKPAKIGLGYGQAPQVTFYRSTYPEKIAALQDLAILKITDLEEAPLAVWFNYPIHPTILQASNREFSADFVGYTRGFLQSALGNNLEALFFNGAQAEIVPQIFDKENRFASCELIGKQLGSAIQAIWNETVASDSFSFHVEKLAYTLIPQPNGYGITLPVKQYATELSLLVINDQEAFVAIPGELSTVYDSQFKAKKEELGFNHISFLGLTNDAHGYIILPEAWRRKTEESLLSFGGEFYGDETYKRILFLLQKASPITSQ